MENRFQEALNGLKDYRVEWGSIWCAREDYKNYISTLQELIDLYNNESKYESFAEIHKDHQDEIARLEESIKLKNSYIFMLEKALDKCVEMYCLTKEDLMLDKQLYPTEVSKISREAIKDQLLNDNSIKDKWVIDMNYHTNTIENRTLFRCDFDPNKL